jgi:hypothetical protein
MDWINVAQDRDQLKALVNTVINLRVAKSAGKFLSSWATGDFSRRTHLHDLLTEMSIHEIGMFAVIFWSYLQLLATITEHT